MHSPQTTSHVGWWQVLLLAASHQLQLGNKHNHVVKIGTNDNVLQVTKTKQLHLKLLTSEFEMSGDLH